MIDFINKQIIINFIFDITSGRKGSGFKEYMGVRNTWS